MAMTSDEEQMRKFDAGMMKARGEAQALIAKGIAAATAQGKPLWTQIEAKFSEFVPVNDQIRTLALANNNAEASKLSMTRSRELVVTIGDLVDQLLALSRQQMQDAKANADDLYDQLAATLATEEFRPRALFDRFRIAVLATTDDPADDLSAHLALRDDPTFGGRVIPTFRADRYMNPQEATWIGKLDALSARADVDARTYGGMLDALRSRRRAFIAAGGTATDTGVIDAGSEPLEPGDAERLHRAGLDGTIDAAGAAAYRRNMLYQLAKMSSEDGLVMQLHPGVIRNHHRPTFDAFGPDTGHDLPAVSLYTEPLTPILRDFGTDPTFRIVLFTVDETAFSREIAPLAGFYPTVYAGAPWWFLDTPAGIARYRAAITDSAGFTKTSGFIDDTRAFCSIPARHDMSRRVDAGFLAGLVATHQLEEEDAVAVARRLVADIPIQTFRLA
jgi:glucuronate isomerase